MASVMSKLGFARFSIAGHDRGGRVASTGAIFSPKRCLKELSKKQGRFFALR
jgi:hypothetical protein